MTEFLVEFELQVPAGTPQPEVNDRLRAESAAAAKLADEGHLVRLWRRPQVGDGTTAVGLYRADSEAQLDALLADLPLADWLDITVTPLEPHPNDPPGGSPIGNRLPDPRLTLVYRLEAVLGEPLDFGEVSEGDRRIVPQTGGTFEGPDMNGKLLPGVSADWQIVLRTAPPSATSATRSRPMTAHCSTSNHVACATAARRCSHVSDAARKSTPASTRSAPPPRSRRLPRGSTG